VLKVPRGEEVSLTRFAYNLFGGVGGTKIYLHRLYNVKLNCLFNTVKVVQRQRLITSYFWYDVSCYIQIIMIFFWSCLFF
jgi:hypothetical protein